MNKVEINCQKEGNAKFYYASRKMFFESKAIKLTAFLISIVPIVLSLVPIGDKKIIVFSATMVSFALAVILELLSTFLTNHKEKSVLLSQLYKAGVTDCTFSKTEYDREMTNSLNELAIRRAEGKISSLKKFHTVNVPKEVDDKYTYLYVCRLDAASNNFLMSRMYGVYIFSLALISALFVGFAFIKNNTFEFLQLVIQFYPLLLPIIRNINACNKAMKYYTKISADIDNFFADGNKSTEKRARFIYYIQNIEFQAMMETPAKYAIFSRLFRGGLKRLDRGVTNRFIDAVEKIEGKKRTRIEPVPLKQPKEKKDKKLEKEQKVKDKKVSKTKKPVKKEEKKVVKKVENKKEKPKNNAKIKENNKNLQKKTEKTTKKSK